MIRIGRFRFLCLLPLFFILLITGVNTDEISNLLYCSLLVAGAIVGAWNLIHYRKFKELKIENELLKLKLKECERNNAPITLP